jgi:hypothetical protein
MITFPAFAIFKNVKISMSIYLYQAVALGQSGNIYLSMDSLYPLGASLTGSPFELASPMSALRGGRRARDPKDNIYYYGAFKKTLFLSSLETPFIDKQNTIAIDKWPRLITLEAELSDKQSL